MVEFTSRQIESSFFFPASFTRTEICELSFRRTGALHPFNQSWQLLICPLTAQQPQSHIFAFHWTSANDLLLVSNAGFEWLQVSPYRVCVSSLKDPLGKEAREGREVAGTANSVDELSGWHNTFSIC